MTTATRKCQRCGNLTPTAKMRTIADPYPAGMGDAKLTLEVCLGCIGTRTRIDDGSWLSSAAMERMRVLLDMTPDELATEVRLA